MRKEQERTRGIYTNIPIAPRSLSCFQTMSLPYRTLRCSLPQSATGQVHSCFAETIGGLSFLVLRDFPPLPPRARPPRPRARPRPLYERVAGCTKSSSASLGASRASRYVALAFPFPLRSTILSISISSDDGLEMAWKHLASMICPQRNPYNLRPSSSLPLVTRGSQHFAHTAIFLGSSRTPLGPLPESSRIVIVALSARSFEKPGGGLCGWVYSGE